ncbi:MAG TPA: hypothetical protein GXZ30_00920 [Propionibacterium sp.]|jgi:hypothetical protein|nr:hypothetical protein [Propionibacterium sp.]
MTDSTQPDIPEDDPYASELPPEDRIDSLLIDFTEGRTIGLVDLDGAPDRQFDIALLDIDGDGQAEVWVRRLDEDGGYEISYDTDGDHAPDSTEIWTRQQLCKALPHIVDLLDLCWAPEDAGAIEEQGDQT